MYQRQNHPQIQRHKKKARTLKRSKGIYSTRKLVLFCVCFVTFMHIFLVSNYMKGHKGSVPSTSSTSDNDGNGGSHPDIAAIIGLDFQGGERNVTSYTEPEKKVELVASAADSMAGSSRVDGGGGGGEFVAKKVDEESHSEEKKSSKVDMKNRLLSPEVEGNIETSQPKATIAYAISLTSCSANFIADGAAVLQHSIHLNSFPQHETSEYASQMVAFIHPSAIECAKPFTSLGYKVMQKEVPIKVSEIEGDFLREKVGKTGCCGDKEFLKLYAYTLVEYPIVVHLDLDALILQPLDDLFDVMMGEGGSEGGNGGTNTKANTSQQQDKKFSPSVRVMHDAPLPANVEAFFTRDYNMIQPGHKHPGMQGGFLIVKPSLEYFEEYRRVILKGNFRPGGGWDGKYGGYFGAQQIQGLCSYFFDALHPGTAVELNRCYYNSMSDSPYGKKRGTDEEACRDGKEICEDCRKTDLVDIKSVHFTLCQKPWICPLGVANRNKLCGGFHRKWFEVRQMWEKSVGNEMLKENESGAGSLEAKTDDIFMGYCKGWGERNYKRITVD